MKLMYRANEAAGKGTYWDISSGSRVDLEGSGFLPGEEAVMYLKIPAGGMLLLGPIVGFLYAVFLPLIGILMILELAGEKLFGGVFALVMRSVSFGWRPRTAYLDGGNIKKSAGEGGKSPKSEASGVGRKETGGKGD